jgi:hypothetical protein
MTLFLRRCDLNLTSKISKRLHSLFRVTEPQSWGRISAADVLAVPDVGKGTLNKLRLYLAHRGISLRGDNPPPYWLETLSSRDTGEFNQTWGVCPFQIVIDSNESNPFLFDQIYDSQDRLIKVPTVRRPLYLSGLADYTIAGYETEIQIERKADDLYSSMSERRDIFESEIERLNDMCDFAAVICEIPRSTVIMDNNRFGARAKSIINTVSSWRVRFPGVHFIFCDGRWDAEQECWRLLSGWWWRRQRMQSEQVIKEITDDIFADV